MGRLRSRRDFDRVFGQGRVLVGRLLVLRVARGTTSGSRIGFAVGRQLGGAVVRNRLRRRWREVVRLGPPLPGEWDLVLVARAPSRLADTAALAAGWREAVRRAGLGGSWG